MCTTPSLSARWLFLACMVSFPLFGQKAVRSAGPAKAKDGKLPVQLPDATSGVAYNKKIAGALGLATGDLRCGDPVPPLPDGITLTCTSELKLGGTPTTSKDVLVRSAVKVTDVLDHTVELDLTFVLRPATETVIVGGPKPKPAEPTPVAPPPDYSKISFQQTTPIVEGGVTVAGFITPALGKAATKFSVRAWIKPGGQPEYLAQLKPPAGSTVSTQQVALGADSSYSLTFLTPLAGGERVRLSLVDADGNDVKDIRRDLKASIHLDSTGVRLTSEVVAGASSISGSVDMPDPAVAPDPKAIPPTYGNYPQIVVWVRDADLGLWSEAPLVATGSGASGTVLFQSVQPDGSFTVTLKNPLKAGQEVRVRAVPPFGRTFSSAGAEPLREPGRSILKHGMVPSAVILTPPGLSTVLTEGTTVLTGIATPSSAGIAVSVAVLEVKPTIKGREDETTAVCIDSNSLSEYFGDGKGPTEIKQRGRLLNLTSSGSNVLLAPVDANGGFKLTLSEELKEEDEIQIVQVLPTGTNLAEPQRVKCASKTVKVTYPFDWHRINLTFVAGVLISNSAKTSTSDANFSQANQFYAFNADRAWRLPGVDCVGGHEGKDRHSANGFAFGRKEYGPCSGVGWQASRLPGINTYFEGRLTSIPVSTAAANPTSGTTGASGTSGTSSLLTSQKVFRVSTGIFFPWVVGHGAGRHPNGIFIAPLAKAGFDTVTGAGNSTNVLLPGGNPGTLNYQTAYNYFAFGGRLGNMELSASHDRAPKIDHYFDVTIGRYSNLQSYICHQLKNGQTPSNLPGSSCGVDYPQYFPGKSPPVVESRKQLYRLDFEGLVKIPVPATAIPFYIGFNANIAQHTIGAEGLDHGYAPPDDIRILFGTKIDIGSLLSTFKLGTN